MKVQSTDQTKANAIVRRNESFRSFLLELFNLEDYFLYDLDNEEEKEFLAP